MRGRASSRRLSEQATLEQFKNAELDLGLGLGSAGGGFRATSTLSMRRPSMSITSNRMPPHSNASAVFGTRPSRAITKPPIV